MLSDVWWVVALCSSVGLLPSRSEAGEIIGGGGAILLGTGSPSNIEAASQLAEDLAIDEGRGSPVTALVAPRRRRQLPAGRRRCGDRA